LRLNIATITVNMLTSLSNLDERLISIGDTQESNQRKIGLIRDNQREIMKDLESWTHSVEDKTISVFRDLSTILTDDDLTETTLLEQDLTEMTQQESFGLDMTERIHTIEKDMEKLVIATGLSVEY
jgi:hypothetical protein